MNRAHNFSAGPAVLPVPVLEETAQAVLNYNNLGMSIMEMSHRSKEFDAVFVETQNDALKLMNLSKDDYTVLFLGGGASLQFIMVPMNFLSNKADYVNTGEWAKKSIKEAKYVGQCNVVASSEDKVFNYIPKDIKFNPDADYVHITTNNTIFGTRWNQMPDVGDVPLVADMSSDIFSRELDFSKFNLIYAGAQKNIGPAGVTMVVINKAWLEAKAKDTAPTMLKYKTHVEKDSMFNTPPCLPTYIVGRTFKWIMNQGGLAVIEANNIKKANLLYDFIDANSGFYKGTIPDKTDRSLMNVCWNLNTPELEAKFIAQAKERYNMTNLKGHRSVGGIRASIYNACPLSTVEALVKFMEEFMSENR
ncbi:MAG: phosphoserine aminotransferase [Bacteroidota bacterium]|nr:phosphoserine aminotransferase [Bacteroidota bacterium]